jgi:outer membrane biosynthesis protein TonB
VIARFAGVERFVAILALVAGAAGACAKQKPVIAADGPALAMPLPPARVFAPPEEPIPVQAPQPEVADAEPPKPAPPRAVRPPRSAPPAEAAKPEPEPPPVVAAPAQPEPGRELRTTSSAADAAAEKQVRDLLQKASRDLNRIDYRKLSNEGRSQYDQAKRFAEQADQAIKERNFVFATTLAEKAATLAAQLGG